jgi:hypothetical protein
MTGSGARSLTFAAVLAALSFLAAGCGGSKAPPVANVAATTTTTASAAGSPTRTGGAADAGPPVSKTQLQQSTLKYSECMRANGVPNFPDPSAGGGFEFQAGSGIDPSSSAFQAAQTKCRKLLPGGGPPAPGETSHPAPGVLAQFVKIAACMREHGVPSFPDPSTTVPAMPAGGGEISDIEGVIFLFPASMNTQSPAFTRAAAACSFPLHDH